jgi:hypothetical protein
LLLIIASASDSAPAVAPARRQIVIAIGPPGHCQ